MDKNPSLVPLIEDVQNKIALHHHCHKLKTKIDSESIIKHYQSTKSKLKLEIIKLLAYATELKNKPKTLGILLNNKTLDQLLTKNEMHIKHLENLKSLTNDNTFLKTIIRYDKLLGLVRKLALATKNPKKKPIKNACIILEELNA